MPFSSETSDIALTNVIFPAFCFAFVMLFPGKLKSSAQSILSSALRIRPALSPRLWMAALLGRSLSTRLMIMGAVAGSMGLTMPAQAIPNQPGPSYKWVAACTNLPLYAPWPNCPPAYPRQRLFPILVDWMSNPSDAIDSINLHLAYDKTIMAFNASQTTLLCDLRSSSAPPLCPALQPGQGTAPLGTIMEEYSVDQTGLTIQEDPSGLPRLTLTYTPSSPITVSGERNFLALAFDLLVPLDPAATVTYSPSLLPDATLVTDDFYCTKPGGAVVNCSSAHPSVSLRLNPVPGPLAVGGLPVMLHASRRIRRRVRLAAEAR
jgi:hypothetical protein